MNHTIIWQDINDAVRSALDQQWHMRHHSELIAQSDALLARLPGFGNTTTTTGSLLRRYHAQLRQELCLGNRPRAQFNNIDTAGELG